MDRSESVADYVARLTGGRRFDLVYDTVGDAVVDPILAATRRFGSLSLGVFVVVMLSSLDGVLPRVPLE